MRIAQICTFDIDGGAARASYRLHRGMIHLGQESLLLVANKRSTDVTVRQLRAGAMPDEFRVRCLRNIQRHYIDANRAPISNTLFSVPYPGHDLTTLDEVVTADVINLHWVAFFQSPVTIRGLLELGKPVVWTLHDMSAFTGGCHYSSGCSRYRDDCFPCPQLERDPCRLPAAVLDDKIEAIGGSRLIVVTPSKWLATCARRSRLFRHTPVEVIPHSLETDVFAPLPKREAKARLGLAADTFTLLAGGQDGRERRKGFTQLAETLRICLLDAQFRDWVSRNAVRLLWFGNPPDELGLLPVPVVSLAWITSDEKLREIYCAADVYVLPSLEDNLPNTILEAMSCAIPVVAFGAGGIPEIVADGLTGWVVPVGDTGQLAAAILDCLRDRERSAKMGEVGRRAIETGHALPVQAQRYLHLYGELLSAAGRRAGPPRQGGEGVDQTAGTSPGGPRVSESVAVPFEVGTGSAFERIFAWASFEGTQIELDRMRVEVQIELDRMRVEVQALRGRISAMEGTKFWKLRTLWFRFKRLIGFAGRE